MSKTGFIRYKDCGFWAYDVATGIFLKHLIDAADRYLEHNDADWLVELKESWRVLAILGDFGVGFDELTSPEQVTVLKTLIEETCQSLAKRASISSSEARSWNVLDGEGVCTRGDPDVATGPIVELGHAMLALLDGTLPSAPPKTWWYFGTSKGRSTIQMRE